MSFRLHWISTQDFIWIQTSINVSVDDFLRSHLILESIKLPTTYFLLWENFSPMKVICHIFPEARNSSVFNLTSTHFVPFLVIQLKNIGGKETPLYFAENLRVVANILVHVVVGHRQQGKKDLMTTSRETGAHQRRKKKSLPNHQPGKLGEITLLSPTCGWDFWTFEGGSGAVILFLFFVNI